MVENIYRWMIDHWGVGQAWLHVSCIRMIWVVLLTIAGILCIMTFVVLKMDDDPCRYDKEGGMANVVVGFMALALSAVLMLGGSAIKGTQLYSQSVNYVHHTVESQRSDDNRDERADIGNAVSSYMWGYLFGRITSD